ncbi:acyl-CoA N-acyltransferase [Mycena latifolia]|nr:acyl-CoA N-acyltransferase [Mycena latifolia]
MILNDSLPSKSRRISLVPPQEADDAAVAALRSHPDTRRYLRFWPGHVSVEEASEIRRKCDADPARITFNIHALASGSPPKFVGMTIMKDINNEFKSCELGVLICPEYFRGGFATDGLYTTLSYAFEERKLHRVTFYTATDNGGMRGWLDWAGATLEGINRESWSDGSGGYTDVCLYSILSREWTETVKGRLEGRINRECAF